MYFVYILQCKDNSLYTGIAKDIEKRLKEHSDGSGSKYTRARLPLKLVYSEKVDNRSKALKREIGIKRMSRKAKEALIHDTKKE